MWNIEFIKDLIVDKVNVNFALYLQTSLYLSIGQKMCLCTHIITKGLSDKADPWKRKSHKIAENLGSLTVTLKLD